MSNRKAVILSYSFGDFFGQHLAPAFKSLHHINLNHLQKYEAKPVLEDLITRIEPTDVVFLLHDGALPYRKFVMLADQLDD